MPKNKMFQPHATISKQSETIRIAELGALRLYLEENPGDSLTTDQWYNVLEGIGVQLSKLGEQYSIDIENGAFFNKLNLILEAEKVSQHMLNVELLDLRELIQPFLKAVNKSVASTAIKATLAGLSTSLYNAIGSACKNNESNISYNKPNR